MIRECWAENPTVYEVEGDTQAEVFEGLLDLAEQADRLFRKIRVGEVVVDEGKFIAIAFLS